MEAKISLGPAKMHDALADWRTRDGSEMAWEVAIGTLCSDGRSKKNRSNN